VSVKKLYNAGTICTKSTLLNFENFGGNLVLNFENFGNFGQINFEEKEIISIFASKSN
jgi:hypothetical protein